MFQFEKMKIKTVLIGDSGVGKTCIVNMYLNKNFNININTTIGAAFNRKDISDKIKNNRNNKTYLLEIWDTAGQERYNSLLPMYYRGCHSIIMIYDITCKKSFEKLKKYFDEIKIPSDVQLIIVGNKLDKDDFREVKYDDVKEYCKLNNYVFFEVSAKENKNIDTIFDTIIENINVEKLKEKDSNDFIDIKKMEEFQNNSTCCF